MSWLIHNYGNTRKLPYQGKFIEITKNGGFETNDKGLADAMSAYPFIEVKEIEGFTKIPIWKLRQLASRKGLKGLTRASKKVLIQKLKEVKKR